MPDTPLPPLAELRRVARAVRSRHPLAVAARRAAKEGGRPRRNAKAAPVPMDQPASENLTQKAADTSVTGSHSHDAIPLSGYSVGVGPAPIPAILPHSEPTPDISPSFDAKSPLNEQNGHPWGDGSLECAVYCRPLNPRLLLVTFKDGSHGRIVCHPKERARFCPGDTLWAKAAAGKDLYILAGRYNRRGARVL